MSTAYIFTEANKRQRIAREWNSVLRNVSTRHTMLFDMFEEAVSDF